MALPETATPAGPAPLDPDDVLRLQREANERLVLAAIRAQDEADEALAARRQAEAEARELRGREEELLTDHQEARQELRQSEARLRFALRAGRMGTWDLDLTTGALTCSDTCKENYGRQATEPFTYEILAASVLDEDRPRWRREVEEAIAGAVDLAIEYRTRWPDGSIHWVLVQASCTTDASGRTVALSGVSLPIDERKRVEEQLREQDRRKDEFLATLAHELRNPLAPIRTGLELIRQRPTSDPAVLRAQHIMDRQLGHLVRLVDDLLDVSRLSRGKLELRRERVAVQAVVDHAVEASRPVIEAAGHTLSVQVPGEPIWLEGDLTRLVQVVSNLLHNAAKYTPAGGRITLSVETAAGEVLVRVVDNGTGIAPEMLPRVFDLFTQVNRTLNRAQGGLGIGLSLVQELLALHGGSIAAESPGPGLGSTFTVRLPRLAPALAPASVAPTSPRALAPTVRRILVVDDNEDGADMLADVLAMRGHQTRTAYDGEEALVTAHSFLPEVVFLDIGLPGIDGYEVARQMRASTPLAAVTLVALTGWGAESDKRRSQAAGFDVHLTKPINLGAVEELLARLSCAPRSP